MIPPTSIRRARGFTLAELTVVFLIVSIMLATAMYTLSAQTEQRNFEETRRRLEAARELLLGFAVANGRLPCPATAASTGTEAITTPPNCDSPYGGFLPSKAIGFQVTNTAGLAIDAWQNPIRYVVSHAAPTGCAATSTAPHFTNATNPRTIGISCRPNALGAAHRSPATVTNLVCDANTTVTNQNVVVAIVYSTGKNGTTGGTGTNEARNLDNNALFVSRPPDALQAVGGEFDDQMTWIAVGEFYGKLIAAGVLP